MNAKSLGRTLEALRDVDGTLGSFLVNADGDLVFADLPAELLDSARQAGPRLARLRDALALSEGDVSACNLRFAHTKLSFAPAAGGLLAVLASLNVNDSSLRTALNLARRRIVPDDLIEVGLGVSVEPSSLDLNTTLVSSAPVVPVQAQAPPTSRAGAGAPESASTSSPRKDRAVFFRGKRVS